MHARSARLLCFVPLLAAAPLAGQVPAPAVPAWAAAAASDPAPPGDRQGWFTRDKLYHFGVSAAGSGALYAGGRRVGIGRGRALAASALVMGAAGVWREVGTTDRADLLTRRRLSRRDLVWNGVGIAAGLAAADRWLGPGTRSDEPLPPPPPPPLPAPEAAGHAP